MGKLSERIKAPKLDVEIGARFTVGQRADPDDNALTERAGALPEPLQAIARQYIGARRRSGAALLDMARWLSEAKQIAVHGQWGVFLEATGTSDDTAERLLNIHRLAMEDSRFADAIARDWLSQSAAALLARPSTPPTLIADVLEEAQRPNSEPPTKASIESRLPKSKAAQNPHSADFDDAIPPPERRGTRLGPGQPPPAPWPEPPLGWRWNRRGVPAHLIAPDGWETQNYNDPNRALAEAQERIANQSPTALDFDAIRARWAALDWQLLPDLNRPGHEHYRLMPMAGRADGRTVGITNMTWYSVVSRLEAQERAATLAQITLPAEPNADEALPWLGSVCEQFSAAANRAQWCVAHIHELRQGRDQILAEEANRLVAELELLIEALT